MSVINEKLIQTEYGFLGDVVYLNTSSIGLPPLRTQRAASRFMESYVESLCVNGITSLGPRQIKVKEMLAELIHADIDEIAFTKSTTEGISIVAQGYPFEKTDNVVVCDMENPSNLYPWIGASKKCGYELKLIKTDGRSFTEEQLFAAVDENTKAIGLSAVQFGTGICLDLERIGRFCRERNILFVVDGIQALGRLEIDVKKMHIDVLSCGCYKAMMATFGTGIMYCRKGLIEKLTPPYIGGSSAVYEPDPPQTLDSIDEVSLRSDAERFEGSTTNAIGIALLESSLSLILELGKENIQNHVRGLEILLREKLQGCGLDILPQSENLSGVLVMYYDEKHYDRASDIFEKAKIRVTHRPGYIRLSIGLHNSVSDIEKAADALKQLGRL